MFGWFTRTRFLSPDARGRILGALAILAFLAKIALAATTYGTNDVATFEAMQQQAHSSRVLDLYLNGTQVRYDGQLLPVTQMNHPPFVLRLLQFWRLCHRILGGSLGFWLRFTCAVADLFTFFLIGRLFGASPGSFWKLAALAVAPASIMISGFHGNTDPIMICFVVLAAYAADRGLPPWVAGLALGLACSIKVWPLVFLPVFWLSARTLKRRAAFLASCLAAAAVLALPWLIRFPALILDRVFDYAPMQGWWGFLFLLPGTANTFRTAVFVAIAAATAYMHQRVRSVFVQCGIIAFIFLFLTPGFGPQYLAWVIPWTVAVGLSPAILFHMAAGFYCFEMYTAWSARVPWYFANSHINPIPHWVLQAGLAAWAVLPLMASESYRANRQALVPARTSTPPLPAAYSGSPVPLRVVGR